MSTSRWTSAAMIGLLLVRCAQAQQTASGADRKLFDYANRERGAQGLPKLKWDDALAAAARKHAEEMSKHGSISHRFAGEPSLPGRATKAGARYSSLAENVAQASSAVAVHEEWMNSPPHRANILDIDMDSLGVGVSERGGEVFAVEDFSKAR